MRCLAFAKTQSSIDLIQTKIGKLQHYAFTSHRCRTKSNPLLIFQRAQITFVPFARCWARLGLQEKSRIVDLVGVLSMKDLDNLASGKKPLPLGFTRLLFRVIPLKPLSLLLRAGFLLDHTVVDLVPCKPIDLRCALLILLTTDGKLEYLQSSFVFIQHRLNDKYFSSLHNISYHRLNANNSDSHLTRSTGLKTYTIHLIITVEIS